VAGFDTAARLIAVPGGRRHLLAANRLHFRERG
jgi:hypothetical protein